MSIARVRTRTAWFGCKHTDYNATAPPKQTLENITTWSCFVSFFLANIASHFTLTEPSRTETPRLGLGEPGLKFKLLFQDSKNNPATVFTSGEFVKLTVTCPNLDVQGVKDNYKPNSDGVVEVSGITLTPNASGKVQYGRDQIVRVDVTGIDYSNYVTFPVKIKAGKNGTGRSCLRIILLSL